MKNLMVPAAVCVSAVSILGWAKLQSHGTTLVHDIREGIDRASPDAHEADRIRLLLNDRSQQLRGQHAKIDRLARKADQANVEAEALVEAIQEAEAILGRAGTLLKGEEVSFEIGGRSYSRHEVEADVRGRLGDLEHLRIQLETKQVIAGDLERAVTEHRARVAVAEQEVKKTMAELETLDLRLESARLQSMARSLSDEIGLGDPSGVSELSDSLNSYVARVEEAEARAGHPGLRSEVGRLVDWEGRPASEDLLADIEAALTRSGGGDADLGEAAIPAHALVRGAAAAGAADALGPDGGAE